ncbi:AbiH family protein [Flavobacterium sp. ZT3P35]|uniref:AbiH family protein n=1 Tax=Flavobacterium sp. ZT3P35 TaxID=3401727 RepID=UPI003AAA49F7
MRKVFINMNRLVIIGNGFDLAHGLPTSYKDFIDDYWKNVCDTKGTKTIINQNDNFVTIICKFGYSYNTSEYDAIDSLKSYDELKNFVERNIQMKSGDFVIEFKNLFFKKISENSIENWVDIENEYYKLLKQCIKKDNNSSIIKLNKEFEDLKKLFELYLIEKVEKEYNFSKDVVRKFINIFDVNRYENLELDRFFMEISKQTEIFLVKEHKEYLDKSRPSKGYLPSDDISHKVDVEHHFLSFNYTSTVFNYIKALDMNLYNLNEIHGRLEDERNLINFGFGDEMDKHYQEIEEKDDNEYLKNIKSFQYLHTPNYKRLLNLIDSDKFQVYIMGHSCGLSDRTLLNTIFEHENCCSIKIFFHEILNEQGEVIKDNYTEITQNISRHFNKKKLMREKIVNKTLCQPLPQIQLPLK